MPQIERDFSFKDANQHWEQEIDDFKLGSHFSKHSSKLNEIALSICTITKDDKEFVGYGKGSGQQNELSAKFEALEHYYATIYATKDVQLYSLEQMQANDMEYIADKIPVDILENQELHTTPYAWTPFQEYQGHKRIYLPTVSILPDYHLNKIENDLFPYEQIYLEYGDNGVAIGCSKEDALIHSILEIIERDAWSFFVYTCILNTNNKIHLFKHSLLPLAIKEKIKAFTQTYNCELLIFEMPNDFDIHTIGCLIKTENEILPAKGFGASLSANYALSRAIDEAIQLHLLNQHGALDDMLKLFSQFKKYPSIQQCMTMQFSVDDQGVFIEDNDYFEKDAFQQPLASKLYLEELVHKIKKNNFDLYYREIYTSEQVSVVQTYIPGMEECFTITEGIITQPRARLKKDLSNASQGKHTTISSIT